jgi:hypothetical protein
MHGNPWPRVNRPLFECRIRNEHRADVIEPLPDDPRRDRATGDRRRHRILDHIGQVAAGLRPVERLALPARI